MITSQEIASLVQDQIAKGIQAKADAEQARKLQEEKLEKQRLEVAIVTAEKNLIDALGRISSLVEETTSRTILIHSYCARDEKELSLLQTTEKHVKELVENAGFKTFFENNCAIKTVGSRDLYMEF